MVWNAIGVDVAIASPLFYADLIDDAACMKETGQHRQWPNQLPVENSRHFSCHVEGMLVVVSLNHATS